MEREKRIAYFSKLLKEKEPYGSMEVWYKNKREKMKVYEIDLQFLVYNRYNGRIASFVKSYEKQTGCELDPTKESDIKQIEKFLWDSNITANKSTEKSIKEQGQLKYGIVTKDGVIIDGNRRAMVLSKVLTNDKPVYFRAVVLEETLDENPKEIMRLETTYQMGEDAKVDYNPIEKYLKCKDMVSLDFKPADIGKAMGEKESTIQDYLDIMELMDEYLNKLGHDGIYTRLDDTEGLFVNLNEYLQRYKGSLKNGHRTVSWRYDESDLNDLKLIYFDHIRHVYNTPKGEGLEAKECRVIGQTSKKGSFFSNKEVWEKFRDNHFKAVEPVRKNEPTTDIIRSQNPTQDLEQILKGKDEYWAKNVDSSLKKNMGLTSEALDNLNKRNAPLELLMSAKAKLDSIDTNSKAFLEDENVYSVVDELRKLTELFKTSIKSHQKRK